MQLREFKNTIRGIAERALYHQDHKDLFKPIKVTNEKFSSLGIRGKYPALNMAIDIPHQLRPLIEDQLITLGHKISGAKLLQFKRRKLGLKPSSPVPKGRVGWDSNIKVYPGAIDLLPISQGSATQYHFTPQHPSDDTCHGGGTNKYRRVHGDVPMSIRSHPAPEHSANMTVCLLSCPACSAEEPSTNKAFQLHDLDKICKSKSCNENIKVKDWNCKCQTKWHLCNVHMSCSNIVTTKNVPIHKPCSGTKRRLGPLTHDQLVAIDTKRARNKPPKLLPPAPNILSVKLKERLAHLFKE